MERQIIQRRHALTRGRDRQMQVALLRRLTAGGITDRADGIPNGDLIADIYCWDRLKIRVHAPQAVLPLGHNSRAIQIVIIYLRDRAGRHGRDDRAVFGLNVNAVMRA